MMMRTTIAILLLVASFEAKADPATIGAYLASAWAAIGQAATAAGGWIAANWAYVATVVMNVYGASNARRKMRAEEARAKAEFNASLVDRTVAALTSTPPWRVVYGDPTTGGDIVAIFTSDKTGYNEHGQTYVKPDGYKHLVIVIASHACEAIDDIFVDGSRVGPLDGQGWALDTSLGTGRNYVLAAAYSKGATSLQLAAGTGTVLVGDEISIPGDSTRYTVTVGVTAPGTIQIASPGLLYPASSGSPISLGNEFAWHRSEPRQVQIQPLSFVDVAEPVAVIGQAGYMDGTNGFIDVVPTLSNGNTRITNPHIDRIISVQYSVNAVKSMLRISKHLGADDQTVDPFLNTKFPDEWDSTHRLRGMTYVTMTLDLEEPRFQGAPPEIYFRVRGRKVFDPRTSLTQYTRNNALIVRDYLLSPWGFRCASDDIDDASFIAAANACDTLINFTVTGPGGPFVTSEPTFAFAGVVTSADGQEAVLGDMADSMAGTIVYGAQWKIIPGVWTVPVMFDDATDELTDDDLDGQIEIVQAGAGLDTLYNGVRGTYIAAGRSAPSDFEPYQNAAFRAADGEDLFENVTFPFTDTNARCKNLAMIRTEQNRDSLVIRYPAKLKAFKLTVGDRVRVSSAEYGFVRKVFRVTDWQFALQDPVTLTLQEDAPEIYDQLEAVTADPSPNTMLPHPWDVPPPTGVTAVSGDAHLLRQRDGTVLTRVLVSWNQITSAYVAGGQGKVVVQWRSIAGASMFTTEVSGDATSTYLTDVMAGDALQIVVWIENGLRFKSPSVLLYHRVAGKTTVPGPVEEFGAIVVPGGLLFGWKQCPDDDFDVTILQQVTGLGGIWDPNRRPVWSGTPTTWKMDWPGDGAFSFLCRHRDTSGNLSTETARVELTITDHVITGLVRHWIDNLGNIVGWTYGVIDPEAGDIVGYEPAFWTGSGTTLMSTPTLAVGSASETVTVDVATGISVVAVNDMNPVLNLVTINEVYTNSAPRPVQVEITLSGSMFASLSPDATVANIIVLPYLEIKNETTSAWFFNGLVATKLLNEFNGHLLPGQTKSQVEGYVGSITVPAGHVVRIKHTLQLAGPPGGPGQLTMDVTSRSLRYTTIKA